MKTFNEFYIKKLLDENNICLSESEIANLAEGRFLDTMKKAGLTAALAASSLGLGQAQAQDNVPKQPSRVHVMPLQASSPLAQFWTQKGNVYTPQRGNGVLLKGYTSVQDDALADHQIDFAATNTNQRYQVLSVEGAGLTEDEAIQDALHNAARQAIGATIDAETLVRNDNLVKDSILSTTKAVIGKFQVINSIENKNIIRVNLKVEVQAKSAKNSGSNWEREDFRRVDDQGKFRTYKTTISR